MARAVKVIYTDDVTGKPITDGKVRTVAIVDPDAGTITWVDLSTDTYAQMVVPVASAGVGHKIPRKTIAELKGAPETPGVVEERAPARTDKEQSKAMRAWWAENWEAVGLREPNGSNVGRVPLAVQDAYHALAGTNGSTPKPETTTEPVKAPATKGKPARKAVTPAFLQPADKVSQEEFVQVYQQTGGSIPAIMDALPALTRGAIYSRAATARKRGLLPA